MPLEPLRGAALLRSETWQAAALSSFVYSAVVFRQRPHFGLFGLGNKVRRLPTYMNLYHPREFLHAI